MQTMHPTLLIGSADWDAARLPRAEFDARIASLWRDHPQAAGAIIYGEASDHAALAYLTNLTPKLQPSIALIPREGEPQLLIGGGINMVPAAKPLTFVERLAPLRDASKAIADWVRSRSTGVVLIGGDAMPYELRRSISGEMEAGDVALRARMRIKSPRELQLMREACAKLDTVVVALLEALRAGSSVTECVIFAEHVASKCGAQDVRSLFSLDHGRTLRPFEIPLSEKRDPLQVYLAVRHAGYWAEAFVRVCLVADAPGAKAESRLRALLKVAKPGVSCAELQKAADVAVQMRRHPLCAGVVGTSIGLSLDEATLTADARLEAGAVYSFRAGLLDSVGQGAIVSAMVAMTEQGAELLWPTGEAP